MEEVVSPVDQLKVSLQPDAVSVVEGLPAQSVAEAGETIGAAGGAQA